MKVTHSYYIYFELQIVYKPICIPEDSSPDLIDLLEGLLCKGMAVHSYLEMNIEL